MNAKDNDKSAAKEDMTPADAKAPPNERAKPKYELAQDLVRQEKWTEAEKAAEDAVVADPKSIDALTLATQIYHERLFQFDRAFELNARLVELGSGGLDFIESHLTTGRFDTCATLAAVFQSEVSAKRTQLILGAIRFACLTGEKKPDDALAAGRRLRKDVAGLEKVRWTFAGTEHFVDSNPAFAAHATDWVRLFEALEQGDEKRALAALTALGVPAQ